jgi:hypothetical protein
LAPKARPLRRRARLQFLQTRRSERREKNGRWKFTRWDLLDLSHFKVKLKAEFQGSNYDMYRAEAIVASGRGVLPARFCWGDDDYEHG